MRLTRKFKQQGQRLSFVLASQACAGDSRLHRHDARVRANVLEEERLLQLRSHLVSSWYHSAVDVDKTTREVEGGENAAQRQEC